MQRVLAIDYGDVRTGLAVSDRTGTFAGEAVTFEEWNTERLAARVAAFASVREVGVLVVGLPKNMDGTEGPRAEKTRSFSDLLARESGLPIVLWDERRSSVEAHDILRATGKREKKHKGKVDAVAAALLLEGYLGSLR